KDYKTKKRAIMKTMNLNEFFTSKVIYKDTSLKLQDKLEQDISQASLKKKLVLANILANMVFANHAKLLNSI
ncbi:hypothetical protein, partial [Helicobacter pylori]|uniref:hypothetical protein n=1 Tax=Helicobacter pylori TaxID=210 RepID=UPI00196504B7